MPYYVDDRTEREYEEDFEQAVDYAVRLIDVDKYDFDDAISTAARRYSVEERFLFDSLKELLGNE